MSFLRSVFHVVSPLVLATATLAGGCSQPFKSVACNADTDCPTIDQITHLTYDDAGISVQNVNGVLTETGINVPVSPTSGEPLAAQCCASLCVIQGSGCESGFRLVSKHSGGGFDIDSCAPTELMCVAPSAPAPTN